MIACILIHTSTKQLRMQGVKNMIRKKQKMMEDKEEWVADHLCQEVNQDHQIQNHLHHKKSDPRE